ncbi:MAG: two-component regulator propeller domain-containing protein [Melioribacteraceae bacterium]|nr:two-component regulator propeller domain-containing protein [Melioribacteraceae bacterium]
MSPQIARKVVDFFQPHKKLEKPLTERENDVVNALVEGLSYKLIASKLDISIDTVRQHIRNVYRKLSVNSKARSYRQEAPRRNLRLKTKKMKYRINMLLKRRGNIRFEILNDDNGLSNNTVNAIEQDSLGFLWFATDYGVNKYDGYKFNVFTSNPADSFSIPHNKVRALYTDSQNRLWLGTSGGLSIYDHRKEQFINYLPEFYVRAFAESEPGILWLGTSKGLIKFNAASGNYKHYNLAPDYAEENGKYSIIALAFDYEGYLWIATDGQGVFRFESESETFESPVQATRQTVSAVMLYFVCMRTLRKDFGSVLETGLIYTIERKITSLSSMKKG